MNLTTFARKAWVLLEKIERRSGWLVAAVSTIYFAVVCVLASTKQFWNDELFTFYISRRPTLPDVWNALLTGAEQLPPLFYVITRAFTALFGPGYLAFRLPEILGFWVMGLSLYFFVRSRSSAAYGLVAMVFPWVTESYYYSYEARPYGLIFGFCGVALLFWQSAVEGRRRSAALAGLSLSLAAAISCHYYAILIFVPFALGEAVRLAIRRKLDLPVSISIAAGLLPLVFFLPLIRAAHRYSGTFWAKPQWTNILGFYSYLLHPAILVLVCIPMIVAMPFVVRGPEREGRSGSFDRIPAHEIAAALGFLLIPLVAVFLAKTITGAFTYRYALPAVIGVSILLAWSASVVSSNRPSPGLAIGLIAVGIFSLSGVRTYYEWREAARKSDGSLQLLHDEARGGLPVVIAGPQMFFELSYLAGDKGAPWLTYLADKELGLKYTGTDDVELGLMNMKRWAPLHVADFHSFCGAQKPFFIYGHGAPFSWVVQELKKEQWRLTVKQINSGQILLLATHPNDQRARDIASTERSARE